MYPNSDLDGPRAGDYRTRNYAALNSLVRKGVDPLGNKFESRRSMKELKPSPNFSILNDMKYANIYDRPAGVLSTVLTCAKRDALGLGRPERTNIPATSLRKTLTGILGSK